jgi:tetratricopeptide (TPR) repeat protein
LKTHQIDEAVVSCRKASRLRPDFYFIDQTVVDALMDRCHWDHAIALSREMLDRQPWGFTHHRLGRALLGKGMTDEAILSFQEAVRLSPEVEMAHTSLAEALVRAGRIDEALPHMDKWPPWKQNLFIFQLCPDERRAEAALVAAHQDLRQIGHDKLDSEALMALAEVFQIKRAYDAFGANQEALELLRRAQELGGTDDPAICSLYGWALYQLGQTSEALPWLEKAVAPSGSIDNMPWSGCGLALVHLKLGDREKAEDYYQQSIEWARDHKQHYRIQAYILRETAAAMGDEAAMEEVLREYFPPVKLPPADKSSPAANPESSESEEIDATN